MAARKKRFSKCCRPLQTIKIEKSIFLISPKHFSCPPRRSEAKRIFFFAWRLFDEFFKCSANFGVFLILTGPRLKNPKICSFFSTASTKIRKQNHLLRSSNLRDEIHSKFQVRFCKLTQIKSCL